MNYSTKKALIKEGMIARLSNDSKCPYDSLNSSVRDEEKVDLWSYGWRLASKSMLEVLDKLDREEEN